MIFTDRTITVRKGESRIDEPIVVYRGDYELEVRFTILNSRFKFMSGTNMIESEKASYGQLAILTPYGGNIFSDIVRCNDGSVTFVLTAEMLNQIEEVGLYSFQIRLMDYNKESRVSIPPIEFGIEVREPIASEDHDNSVNNAIVGYSIAKVVDPKEENVGDTFDENGNYNKTKWETGDRISEGKLNKIEDAIDKINKNEVSNAAVLSRRIDNNFNVLDSIIESELAQTNAQLSEIDSKKATLSYVDTVISQIKSATPKGVYANLNELISVKPTGDDNIYLTSDNGHWNYWNGSTWVSGGLYQAIEIENNSIAKHKLNFNAVNGMDSFNLFNPEVVTKRHYVSQVAGSLIANSDFNVSEFIPVSENLTYLVKVEKGNVNHPMAWYDEDKNFISGNVMSTTKCGFLTSPTGAKFCRLTIKATTDENQMDNFLFCQSDGVEEYVPYGHTVGTEQLDFKACELVKSNNMFDKNNVIVDSYISGVRGGLGTSTNHVASDWIIVKPSTDYTFSKLSGNFEQYAFYDKDQNFISGVTNPSNGKYTTPSNCYYVRHTVSKVQLDNFMLNEGGEMEYEPFGYFIPKEVMPFNNNADGFIKIITVDKNGNGDFTSIYDAVMSITSTSPTNRYEIRIAEGEYDIISELPTEMINNPNSFPGGRGLDIPSYVKLVGVGHRDKIIIKGELPDNATAEQVRYLSTLNYGGDVILENLTITAKNMRYPIHADSGSHIHNNVYQVINCHVIHYGNQPSKWQYCSCFGSGHGKNAKVLMKDSRFETYGENSNAWGIHNYKTATEKSNMTLENCEFISHNGGTSCNFDSLGSGIKDYALIKNCYIPNGVTLTENSSGVGIDIVVEGYNNSTSLTKY